MNSTKDHRRFSGKRLTPPRLNFLFEADVTTNEPVDLGVSISGHQFTILLPEGRFDGPGMSGHLLPDGACLTNMLMRPDGITRTWGTLGLETHDGHRISMQAYGFLWLPPDQVQALAIGKPYDPSSMTFRSSAHFSAADNGPYAWLNRVICVLSGTTRLAQSATFTAWSMP